LPWVGHGIARGAPSLSLIHPKDLGDGTLSGALRREAETIFNNVNDMRKRGLSETEIQTWYNNEWDRLAEEQPQLFQPEVWNEVFPDAAIQEDVAPQAEVTPGNVRVTRKKKKERDEDEDEDDDREDSCDHLACPDAIPGSKYRGGAHYCTRFPIGDGLDSHHMPARGYGNRFPPERGPAIQMEREDHWKTASHPRSRELGKDYIKQAALLRMGQNYTVFKMDVDDILDVEYLISQPGKYAAALAQAAAYMECLKQKNYVQ